MGERKRKLRNEKGLKKDGKREREGGIGMGKWGEV